MNSLFKSRALNLFNLPRNIDEKVHSGTLLILSGITG